MADTNNNPNFASQWLNAIGGDPQSAAPQVTLRRQGWGQLEYGTSLAGAKPFLAGRRFDHGLGTHADSEIMVTPVAATSRFQATVGIDDNPNTRGHCEAALVFTVSAD